MNQPFAIVTGASAGIGLELAAITAVVVGGASLLELLGDWPWYLLVAFAVAAAVWALITWPWTRRTRAQQ